MSSNSQRQQRRVLIVSPNFPPINTPDHQRIRMSLPHFKEFGWDYHVLALRPNVRHDYKKRIDIFLERTVPDDAEITLAGAFPVPKLKFIGEAQLGVRALPSLLRAGDKLLRSRQFDLVYFSTTMFPPMSLGPRWRRKFGVPYIIDLQDPWVNDYYEREDAPLPPGGRWKHELSQAMARTLESSTMRHVAHVICVSPSYPRVLSARYPWLSQDKFTVLPFGAAEADFESIPDYDVRQSTFDPEDGARHLVYVGRVGPYMTKAVRILFTAIKRQRQRQPERFKSLRLHFVGTDYAPEGRAVKSVEPIANEVGIADLVEESTSRVPYLEALNILMDGDGILLFGSDDPSYTASKLYPCILARRPILAISHEGSSVVDILRRCNSGRVVTFPTDGGGESVLNDASHQLDWLLSLPKGYSPDTNWSEFEPYTAREMTRKQCEVFERYVKR